MPSPSKSQRQSQQLRKKWHTKPRNWIPPFRRIPRCKRDDAAAYDRSARLAVDAVAADALASSDVCEACVGDCVDCRFGELEGCFSWNGMDRMQLNWIDLD